jgi:hypothetical protein
MEKAAPKKEEPMVVSDHTDKIKSQVLAKIGKPTRLDRVEVCQHHGRKPPRIIPMKMSSRFMEDQTNLKCGGTGWYKNSGAGPRAR